MNAEQLRMARALLRISVRDLAKEAGVNPGTIINLEGGTKGQAATIVRLRETLQAKGVVFIGELEPFHEPGVAMRWGEKPPAVASEDEAGNEAGDAGQGSSAQPWDKAEAHLDSGDIEEMRRYWAEGDRWRRLSEPSRKALARAIGSLDLRS